MNSNWLATVLNNKRIVTWLALVLLIMIALRSQSQWQNPQQLVDTLAQSGSAFWLIWLGLQIAFALLMIPSLPLVIAASFCFPQHALLVLLMSLLGVAASATAIYFNANWLGMRALLLGRPRLAWLQKRLHADSGFALALWCAAPFLPSDLGCYAAAASGMRFARYLVAVLAGECVLCAGVIYGSAGLVS
jgi:uncharacterized membrane protein YdjX (TVP38/TMEM64 family)